MANLCQVSTNGNSRNTTLPVQRTLSFHAIEDSSVNKSINPVTCWESLIGVSSTQFRTWLKSQLSEKELCMKAWLNIIRAEWCMCGTYSDECVIGSPLTPSTFLRERLGITLASALTARHYTKDQFVKPIIKPSACSRYGILSLVVQEDWFTGQLFKECPRSVRVDSFVRVDVIYFSPGKRREVFGL